MYSRIIATGRLSPRNRVTNDELAARLLLGRHRNERRMDPHPHRDRSAPLLRPTQGEGTTSLAVAAAREALGRSRAGRLRNRPHHRGDDHSRPDLPSTAAQVQPRSSAARCAAFDVQALCGLHLAR